MSIFQKGRGSLWKGPSEKHVVSILLWFVFFVDFSWLHTFLCGIWTQWAVSEPVIQKRMTLEDRLILKTPRLFPTPNWDTITISTLSLSIKVQKRNGIARRKSTKINVHFSKGSWDFAEWALWKMRYEHNDVKLLFWMKKLTAYFFICFVGQRV